MTQSNMHYRNCSELVALYETNAAGPETVSDGDLIELLHSHQEPLCTWYLIRALGTRGCKEAAGLITQICRRPDVEFDHTSIHLMCAWYFGKVGREVLPLVIDILQTGEEATRVCAVDALGEMRLEETAHLLSEVLNTGGSAEQLWASLSLAKLGDAAVPYLAQYLADPRDRIRYLTIDALTKVGTITSKALLADRLIPTNSLPE